MASYAKYQDFVEQLCLAKHDFGSHVFKVGLATGAPDATHTIRGSVTEYPPPTATRWAVPPRPSAFRKPPAQ